MSKTRIAGIEVDNVNMVEAVAQIARMVAHRAKPHIVCTANLDHLVTMERDVAFYDIYLDADMVVADGMPLVWLSWLTGRPLKERVTGSDMFFALARHSGETGLRLFFMGGRTGSAENAAEVVREQYKANVVGTYCPPPGSLNTPEEDAKIAEIIQAAQPDVLLVALGSPKQEKWIAAHRYALNVPVSIGVGGSFEMAAGSVKRAPKWVQRIGAEWLYRLIQEPHRLARRYLVHDLPQLPRLIVKTVAESRETVVKPAPIPTPTRIAPAPPTHGRSSTPDIS